MSTATINVNTLGGGRARGEFNRALRRLSRLKQGQDGVHEITLKAWIRNSQHRGKRQIKWSVRTNIANIATGRKEVSLAQGRGTK